ncbi:MAG: hypothetical protein IKL08_06055 [Clostridia bacterium]|nr:hypothetical protein [Clostridia bacterium]
MNGLDLFLIILLMFLLLGGIALSVSSFKDDMFDAGFGVLIFTLVFSGLIAIAFIVIDKGSGASIGEITSVDKNFFGTTALYVKTSETEQEEYCIEDEEVAKQAAELIGKKVKISYGERVGVYSTGRCSQAPVDKIEVIE